MNWKYKDREIKDHSCLPKDTTHIVYRLTYTDDTMYIGYKTVRSELTVPATKKDIETIPDELIGRNILRDDWGKIATSKREKERLRRLGYKAKREYYKKVFKDMPFVSYTGSSKENKGKAILGKEILYCSSNRRTATYLEVKLLMSFEVLESDTYNNANISGRFYDNCLDGLIKERNEKY